ncbi:MAG: polysaccharide biosynthesis/export family protein [Clostridium sp.]|nr:polysaccharide biosynthesis/export family protein [Clostridium sp.]
MKFVKLLAVMAIAALASCGTPKNIAYFQDVQGGSEIHVSQPYQVKVQPGDKLRIIVSTQDERLTNMFNISSGSGSTSVSGSGGGGLGYTVTSQGTIDFPVVGEVRVAGMNREQIAAEIKGILQSRDLIKEPVVIVDFLNLGVTVLGDVKSPGHFSISNDRYTILEAIADAGDLAITGERTNIKIIRQEVGKQSVYEVNLNNATELYSSPAFFLQQNDVIYVTPNNKKKRESTINGNTPLTYGFWMSLASFLMSTALFITR